MASTDSVTIQPDLRHYRAHYMALLWACPHDHAPLRVKVAEEWQAGAFAKPAAAPGLYSCDIHDWRFSEDREWSEVGAYLASMKKESNVA